MKKTYPKYKKGSLQKIENKLNDKNKRELKEFANYLLITNKQDKVTKILRLLIQYYDITGKNLYEKPTIKDRNDFLALLNNSDYKDSYKREIKVYLKKWLKWKWKDLTLLEDFPKLEKNSSDKVEEKDLLTLDEIKKLLKGEPSDMWKALISILAESGCRPEEVLNLKWEQINFKEDIVDISFHTKKKSSVKSRIFPIKAGYGFLKNWKETCPSISKESWVFPSRRNKPLTNEGLNVHLKRLAKKVGIERNVFPYLFRFTKASELYNGNNKLDDRAVASLLGHSTNMAKTYHKLSNETAREMLIEETFKEKEIPENKKEKLIKEVLFLQKNFEKIKELLFQQSQEIIKLKK